MESRENPFLEGQWSLDNVKIGFDAGYSEPMSAQEFGIGITLTFNADHTFLMMHEDSTGIRQNSGSWSTTPFILTFQFENGGISSTRYSVSEERLQYGSQSYVIVASRMMSVLFEFHRENVRKYIY